LKLRFLGATGTVTGSKYLLSTGVSNLLVDCGLFQGLKALRERNWRPLPVAPAAIQHVLLTHAHLDHSGYVPLLVKRGYRGRVSASRGTCDLCRILLPDAGHLQEEEAQYAARHGFSRHHPPQPLYAEADAFTSLQRFDGLDFGQATDFGGAYRATLHPAGHILGAAIIEIEAEGVRVVFSGDLGRMNDPLMRPPTPLRETDYLIVESTYGNRRHDPAEPGAVLARHLTRALARGGVVVVPAFAVGRAQTLLYLIHRLKAQRAIPDVPVFLNSPMAADVTQLYQRYQAEHRLSAADYAAACRSAVIVNSADESRALNRKQGPMIIISASGMATGGRVLHHLKAFAPDPRNMILLAGFQAAGTRGAALAAGTDAVKIHGGYVPVRAEVVQLDNLSAHADYAEILQWLEGFAHPPRRVFVTHGEPAAADELRRRITERLGWRVSVPEYLEEVNLE